MDTNNVVRVETRQRQHDEVTRVQTFRAILERGSDDSNLIQTESMPQKHQTGCVFEEAEEKLWYKCSSVQKDNLSVLILYCLSTCHKGIKP